MWKYVSPRRRRLGLLILAMLAAMFYGFWYFTNPSRIRREAKRALEALTGADVDVDRAEFSVFEGIRLYNVRVRIRGDDSPRHCFTARQVVLRHRPGGLLLRHRIEPTKIVCLNPVVNLEYDRDAGTSNLERLFILASGGHGSGGSQVVSLPEIVLKDGLLRSLIKESARRSPPSEEWFNASLKPAEEGAYLVTVEGTGGGGKNIEWARLKLDVASGKIKPLSLRASERWFRHLPPKYRKWISRYALKGDFHLVEGDDTCPEEGRYEIRLTDFAMKLPSHEGGLNLCRVAGTLLFRREGVKIRNVTGRVVEAPTARFELNGEYDGYEADSPFLVGIRVCDVSLPRNIAGPLAETVDLIRRKFQPVGAIDIILTYKRDQESQYSCEGTIRPGKISMTYENFPLPIHDVTGEIHFDQKGVNRIDLTARRGGARFGLTGKLTTDCPDFTGYDVTVHGRGVRFDKALYDAMPERHKKLWRQMNPAGRTDIRVRVARMSPRDHMLIEIDLKMDGFAGMTYHKFPYPLKNISGEVEFRGDTVDILWAHSKVGEMLCKISGKIAAVDTKHPQVDLSIIATRVPLDRTLIGALPEHTRELARSLSPAGLAGRIEATFHRRGADPLDYNIAVTLKDASFRYDKFPYLVSGATGLVTITPGWMLIESVRGAHGRARLQLDGRVALDKEELAYDLVLSGTDLALDEEFHQALPPKVRDVWAAIQPGGLADMNLRLKIPGRGNGVDYRLVIDARDAEMRYRDFPYTFRGIKGRAVVTPGRLRLEKMRAVHGKMTALISGEIRSDGRGGQDVELSISARDVPIDKELLAAIPPQIVPLAKRFNPGGRLNAEIRKLTLHRKGVGGSAQADKPTTNPAANAKVSWNADGELAFRDVSVDIGFGPRKLTGAIDGKMRQDGEKLGIDADVKLDSLQLGKHRLTNVLGRLSKDPRSNVLRIDRIAGRGHDGRLGGEATIRLADPIRYRLSISVENVDLAKLFNAGLTDRKELLDVRGRLSGIIILEAVGGKNPTRQAIGDLEISRARMYKLPVILGMLNVVYLSLPGEFAFNSGFVRYHLKNDKLLFREIYLTSEPGIGISLLGSGTMDMKSEALKLTFITGPPGEMPRLSELAVDILRAVRGELVEIRVGGTLKKPQFTPVTLRSLERIIRRLIAPSLKTE